MRFGVTMFATDQAMDVVALARATEERGFDSLWLPEHTHIPTSRRTPPPTGDAELAEEYKRTLDPLVALGAAATATTTLRLGTGVLLPAQREPIVTAKAVATLDHLSGGRVSLGVGFGWNEDELAHHGVAMADRRAVAAEHIGAMRALWRDDVADYEGHHVHLSPSWSWPKPVQPAGPPVLLGGAGGPVLIDHAVAWADGWIPIGGSGMAEVLPTLRRALETAGREPSTFEIVPFGSVPTPGKLDHFAALGVTECVVRVPSGPADEVLAALDAAAGVVTAWRG